MDLPWPVYALGAAAFIVIRDLAHKQALKHEHTLEMLVGRALFLLPLLLILGFSINTQLPIGTILLIYLVSVIATAGIMLRVRGLRHLDVGEAAPLQNFNPLFLLIIAGVVLQEQPTLIQVGGVLMLVIGTYTLEGSEEYPGILGPLHHLWKDTYAWVIILSTLILSVSQTFDKYLISAGIEPFIYLFWVWLFINMNVLMIHLIRFKWRGLEQDVKRDGKWLAAAALALFCQMLCYYTALEKGPVTLVLPINRLAALGLVIVGGRLFHEEALTRRLIAGALMVIGALLIIL